MLNEYSRVTLNITGQGLLTMASDKNTLDFAHQLVMTGIWIEMLDFIDHVYGKECFFCTWEFDLSEGTVEIKNLIPFNRNKNILAATVEQKDEAILFFQDDSSLAHLMCAYNLTEWDRTAIDIGNERIQV